MATKSGSNNSLQKLFSLNGRSVEIAIPIVASLLCVLGQSFLTPYFNNLSTIDLIGYVVAITILIGAEVLLKRYGHQARVVQYILLHIIAYGGLLLFVPVPNPYLVFGILINMMVYFEFGRRIMIVSMTLSFLAFTAKLLATHGPNFRSDVGVFAVEYVGIGLITYYSVKFVHFAQTELAVAEQNYAQAERLSRRLESLINNVTDGVIAIDEQNVTTNNNAAALDILEINYTIRGKRPYEFMHLTDNAGTAVDFEALLHDIHELYTSRDLLIHYQDGSVANLLMSIVPIHKGFGNADVGGHTILLRDITKEKSLEDERNEFISIVGHELRTPIAIMEGTLDNAKLFSQKPGNEAAIQSSINTAYGQVFSLGSIVNDLATLNDIEATVTPSKIEIIDIPVLVQQVGHTYQPLAAEKGLIITTTITDGVLHLQSNRTHLQKVLNNLLSNALKYTDSGSITLTAEPGVLGGVLFTVTDTGIGVSKNEQTKIFEKFYRSEDFRTRTTGGIGLGLYIVKLLVASLHGTISVTSALGKGSSFRVEVPSEALSVTPQSQPAANVVD